MSNTSATLRDDGDVGIEGWQRRARMRAVTTEVTLPAEALFERVEKMQLLATLSGGLAHDLNNPLTALLLESGVLSRRLDGLRAAAAVADGQAKSRLLDAIDGCAASLATVAAAAEFMTRLTRDFQQASRGSAGDDGADERSSADARGAVEKALRFTRMRACERATIEVITAGDNFEIAMAECTVVRVLVNLIVNSVDAFRVASPKVNRIQIRLSRAEDRVRLDVSDNGPGILAEMREHLFEPFATSKPPGQGTGLGLMVARSLLRRSHGDLSLLATGPEGTTFRCEMRAARGRDPRRD